MRKRRQTTQVPAAQPALIDQETVRGMLACSPRHVSRMAAAGLMPKPIKLGSLLRWNRAVIEQWIAAGCPAVERREEAANA